MKKDDFVRWLEPLSDEYEIYIFSIDEDRPLEVLHDIDFDNKNNRIVIDGRYNIKSKDEINSR